MGRKTATSNISPKDREKMKYIIAPRLKYRDTNEQILERLEDAGHEIGIATLFILKREMRENIGARFKEIAEIELAEEHDLAIQTMKILLKKMLDYADGDIRDIKGQLDTDAMVRISGEIRNINRDLIDYYGSTDMVDSVFKYFKHEKEEAELLKVKETGKKVTKISGEIKEHSLERGSRAGVSSKHEKPVKKRKKKDVSNDDDSDHDDITVMS